MTGSPLHYHDLDLLAILQETKTIALVGASTNWNRPSYFVMKYLQSKGFKLYPINPGAAGQVLLGETVLPDLTALSHRVDMVDVFRPSQAAGPIADQAIEIGARTLWMQLGVRNDQAAARAQAAGLRVVMDRCPKIEYSRLFGELGRIGINTGIIRSKARPPLLPSSSPSSS